MKKHFAKILLLGAMTVAGFAFVGCNDFETELNDLKNKVENLESQTNASAADLQSAINGLKAQLAADYALKTEVSSLKETIEGEIAAQVAAVEAKLNEQVNGEIAKVNSALAALNTAVDSKADKATLEAAVKDLEAAIAAAQSESAAAIATLTGDLEKVAADLKAAKADLEKQLADAEAEFEAALLQNSEDIKSVDAKVLELKATIDDLAVYLEGLEAMVLENKQTLVDLADYLDGLEAMVLENKQTLVDLSDYLAGEAAKVKELKNTIDDFAEYFEQYEYNTKLALDELNGQLTALSSYMEALEDSIDARFAEHQQTFFDLATHLAKVEAQVELNKAMSEGNTAKINELKNTIDDLADYLEGEEAKVMELKNTLDDLSEHLGEVEAANLAKFAEILDTFDSLSDYLDVEAAKVIELKNALDDLSPVISSINAKLAEHQQTLLDLSDHLGEIESTVDFKLTELHGSLTALSEYMEVLDIENTFANFETRIAANTALAEQNKTKLEALQTKLNEELAKVRGENTALEAKIAEDIKVNADAIKANKALIDANTAAIEALKNGVATLKADFDALKATLGDFNAESYAEYQAEVKALVEKNTADIAEVLAQFNAHVAEYQKTIEVVKNEIAEIAARIQSVTFVPEYDDDAMTAEKITVGSGDNASVFVLVGGTFKVQPVEALANVEKEDISFVGVPVKVRAAAEEAFAAKVVDIDKATGRIEAYAYVPKNTDENSVYAKFATTGDTAARFAMVIDQPQQADSTDVNLETTIESEYVPVYYKQATVAENMLKFYNVEEGDVISGDLETSFDVEYSSTIAASKRNLFAGYDWRMVICDSEYTLDEAEYLLGTDLTVTFGTSNAEKPIADYNNFSSITDEQKLIKFNGTDLTSTAQLQTVENLEFKNFINRYATYTINTIKLNGNVTGLKAIATYTIVKEQVSANTIVIEDVTLDWESGYATTYNNGMSGDDKVEYDAMNVIALYDAGTDLKVEGNGTVKMTDLVDSESNSNSIKLTAEDPNGGDDIVIYISPMAKDNVQIVSTSRNLPYGKTLVFTGKATGTGTANSTADPNKEYDIHLTVTIGNEPVDYTADLGTITVPFSSTVDGIEDVTPVTNSYNARGSFYGDDISSMSYIFSTSIHSGIELRPSVNSDNEEESTIVIPMNTSVGTYNVEYVYEVNYVKYTVKAKVVVENPNYSLSTLSRFVDANNTVTVSGTLTMPGIDNSGNPIFAAWTPSTIMLNEYFLVNNVEDTYANDVKVVYEVAEYASDKKFTALWSNEQNPVWINNTPIQTEKTIPAGTPLASVAAYSTYDGSVLTSVELDFIEDVDAVTVTAYLMPMYENNFDKAYDKKTITIKQRERISSFTQKANSGEVEYHTGQTAEINVMTLLEVVDFAGNKIYNENAQNVGNFWDYEKLNIYTDSYALIEPAAYHKFKQEIIFGDVVSPAGTSCVINGDGTLKFTTNSGELQEDVVVTVPVYLTYEYANYGSSAKKVDVKVTFTK